MKECKTGVFYVYHHDFTYPDPLKNAKSKYDFLKKTIIQQTYILLTVD